MVVERCLNDRLKGRAMTQASRAARWAIVDREPEKAYSHARKAARIGLSLIGPPNIVGERGNAVDDSRT